jgi:hypothetical protein
MDGLAIRPYVLSKSGPEVATLTSRSRLTNFCQRRAARHRPDHAERAFVEFDLYDGSRWRLSLLEISDVGICFGLDDNQPSLAVGTPISAATLAVNALRIRGSLQVVHVTTEFAAGTICGAEFVPTTATDRRALILILARLDKRDHQSV